MKLDHYFAALYTKIKSTCIKDFNVRPEIIQFSEIKKIGSMILVIGIGDSFFFFPFFFDTKSKIEYVGLHQTNKFLHNKRTYPQNEKATKYGRKCLQIIFSING